MSPHKHFSRSLAIAGISALLLAPIVKSANTYAEGPSSYFDANAAQCVVDNYNATTGSSVTAIEEVNFDAVTTLDCADRDITHFRGIVLFKNLIMLDLHGNTNLATEYMDFSQNTKLKHLNLYDAGRYYSLDLSHNPDIEVLHLSSTTGYLPNVTLPKGVEKFSDDEEYAYGVDLNNYKWFSGEEFGETGFDKNIYPYRFDESTNRILFKDKTKIPYNIIYSTAGSSFRVNSGIGYMNYRIFLEGDEEVESHNPISLNNNCERIEGVYGGDISYYYSCNNDVYYGDELDTDDLIENTLKKIFNLDAYKLSKVEIVPPSANVELTTDTDTAKKGKILSDASFNLDFHFALKSESESDDSEKSDSPSTPNTGFFTNEDGGVNVANIAIALAGISIITFIALGLTRRLSARSRAHKF